MRARAHVLLGGRLGGRAVPAGCAVAASAALILAAAGCGDGDERVSEAAGKGAEALRAAVGWLAPGVEAGEPSAALRPPLYAVARVREGETVPLRRSPRGRVIEKLGDRTEFGSPRSFWVAEVRGDWLGVPVPELPNGALGWIRDDRDRLDLYQTRYSVVADISERALTLRYGDKVLDRVPVTVGAPGSPTPTGSFSVTDALGGAETGPYYGCCILALSGHQPNLPPGWLGGDRVAIHGTPGDTGLAASGGCLRAGNEDMVGLFARVPLGAPVFIRA